MTDDDHAPKPHPDPIGRVSGAIPAQPGDAPSRAMAADTLPETTTPQSAPDLGDKAQEKAPSVLSGSAMVRDPAASMANPPSGGSSAKAAAVTPPAPTPPDAPNPDAPVPEPRPLPRLIDFDNAQLGAIAHLYRGEVYRSTIWRTRLDNTTNWSIVMMGIALTSAFSSPAASALPLLVVGLLLLVFLVFEARRYRYFNVWRARARWLEQNLYAPMLRGTAVDPHWREVLADDYAHPVHHISFFRALGRRLRRNFIWILAIQSVAYWGKLAIHPFPAQDIHDLMGRAAIGPVPGIAVLAAGAVYNGIWIAVALWSWRADAAKHGPDGGTASMG